MIYYLTLNLIIAHIIADFYLQTNSFCRMKAKFGIKGTQGSVEKRWGNFFN